MVVLGTDFVGNSGGLTIWGGDTGVCHESAIFGRDIRGDAICGDRGGPGTRVGGRVLGAIGNVFAGSSKGSEGGVDLKAVSVVTEDVVCAGGKIIVQLAGKHSGIVIAGARSASEGAGVFDDDFELVGEGDGSA